MRCLADEAGTRAGERSYEKEVSSEKEMCAVRQKAAPLESLANFAGVLPTFQEAHVALLAPLAKSARDFDLFGRKRSPVVCAPWEQISVVSFQLSAISKPGFHGSY